MKKLLHGILTLCSCVLVSSWPGCHDVFDRFVDRVREGSGAATAESSGESPAQSAAPTPLVEPQPSPTVTAPPEAPREPKISIIFDEVEYVRPGDSSILQITLVRAAELSAQIASDRDTPFNLDLYTGHTVSASYVANKAMSKDPVFVMADAIFGDGKKPPVDPDEPTLIFHKKDAYLNFKSEWIALPAGKYSLVMDNSFSEHAPASAALQIMTREPAP